MKRWMMASAACAVAVLTWAAVCAGQQGAGRGAAGAVEFVEMPAEVLVDKVRGGLLGQIIGNLNGLPHEMKYIDEPGDVRGYEPALPEGAWTDDDTDFEWVYVVEMQRRGQLLLPATDLTGLWKERINTRIWCSNRYARHLMDMGFEPPLTGSDLLNPWAEFNISGQFICETFGLMSPAMPRTAGELGLNFTRITIDGEPAQTTQLFTAMIATAYVESDVDKIIDAGVASIDPESRIAQIVRDVRGWHAAHPEDWRATRQLLKEKYTQVSGGMRDRNGYELNTGSTIAALLYGGGDFAKTMTIGFNFGWDADNNTATAGTILGVVSGHRAMMARGWKIVDRYRNETRQNMPMDETITSFADRVVVLAERTIERGGGGRVERDGAAVYRIRMEEPGVTYRTAGEEVRAAALRERFSEEIERGVLRSEDAGERARAAYLAICLGLDEGYRRDQPQKWAAAVESLRGYWKVMENLFHQDGIPRLDALRQRFERAGVRPPAERVSERALWNDTEVWKAAAD